MDKFNFDFNEFQEKLANIDWENVSSWPAFVKNGAFVLTFIAVFAAGTYFLVLDVRKDLIRKQGDEQKLIQQFEEKSFKAANLEEFKKQMEDLDGSYAALLRQLPRETEVPGLLEDITNTGVSSGLKLEKIDLKNEEEVEFYSVLPIDLEVQGGFHGLAGFISGVAALPRIVTLHDFVIEAKNTDRAVGSVLEMSINAKTYRYQGDEE